MQARQVILTLSGKEVIEGEMGQVQFLQKQQIIWPEE